MMHHPQPPTHVPSGSSSTRSDLGAPAVIGSQPPPHSQQSQSMSQPPLQSVSGSGNSGPANTNANANNFPPPVPPRHSNTASTTTTAPPTILTVSSPASGTSPGSSSNTNSNSNTSPMDIRSQATISALQASTSTLLQNFNQNSGALTPAKAKLNQFILDLVKNQIKITDDFSAMCRAKIREKDSLLHSLQVQLHQLAMEKDTLSSEYVLLKSELAQIKKQYNEARAENQRLVESRAHDAVVQSHPSQHHQTPSKSSSVASSPSSSSSHDSAALKAKYEAQIDSALLKQQESYETILNQMKTYLQENENEITKLETQIAVISAERDQARRQLKEEEERSAKRERSLEHKLSKSEAVVADQKQKVATLSRQVEKGSGCCWTFFLVLIFTVLLTAGVFVGLGVKLESTVLGPLLGLPTAAVIKPIQFNAQTCADNCPRSPCTELECTPFFPPPTTCPVIDLEKQCPKFDPATQCPSCPKVKECAECAESQTPCPICPEAAASTDGGVICPPQEVCPTCAVFDHEKECSQLEPQQLLECPPIPPEQVCPPPVPCPATPPLTDSAVDEYDESAPLIQSFRHLFPALIRARDTEYSSSHELAPGTHAPLDVMTILKGWNRTRAQLDQSDQLRIELQESAEKQWKENVEESLKLQRQIEQLQTQLLEFQNKQAQEEDALTNEPKEDLAAINAALQIQYQEAHANYTNALNELNLAELHHQQETAALNQTLIEVQLSNKNLMEVIVSFNRTVHEQEVQLIQAETERNDCSQKLIQLSIATHAAATATGPTEEEKENTASELIELRALSNSLTQEFDQISTQFEAMQKENLELHELNQEYAHQLEEFNANVTVWQNELSQCTQELFAVKSETEEAIAIAVENATATFAQTSTATSTVETDLSATTVPVNETAYNELSLLHDTLANITERYSTLMLELETARAELEEAKANNLADELAEEHESWSTEKMTLIREKEELVQAKADLLAEVEQLKSGASSSATLTTDVNTEQFVQEKAALTDEIESLKKKQVELEASLLEASNGQPTTGGDGDSIAAKDAQIAELEHELSDLKSRLTLAQELARAHESTQRSPRSVTTITPLQDAAITIISPSLIATLGLDDQDFLIQNAVGGVDGICRADTNLYFYFDQILFEDLMCSSAVHSTSDRLEHIKGVIDAWSELINPTFIPPIHAVPVTSDVVVESGSAPVSDETLAELDALKRANQGLRDELAEMTTVQEHQEKLIQEHQATDPAAMNDSTESAEELRRLKEANEQLELDAIELRRKLATLEQSASTASTSTTSTTDSIDESNSLSAIEVQELRSLNDQLLLEVKELRAKTAEVKPATGGSDLTSCLKTSAALNERVAQLQASLTRPAAPANGTQANSQEIAAIRADYETRIKQLEGELSEKELTQSTRDSTNTTDPQSTSSDLIARVRVMENETKVLRTEITHLLEQQQSGHLSLSRPLGPRSQSAPKSVEEFLQFTGEIYDALISFDLFQLQYLSPPQRILTILVYVMVDVIIFQFLLPKRRLWISFIILLWLGVTGACALTQLWLGMVLGATNTILAILMFIKPNSLFAVAISFGGDKEEPKQITNGILSLPPTTTTATASLPTPPLPMLMQPPPTNKTNALPTPPQPKPIDLSSPLLPPSRPAMPPPSTSAPTPFMPPPMPQQPPQHDMVAPPTQSPRNAPAGPAAGVPAPIMMPAKQPSTLIPPQPPTLTSEIEQQSFEATPNLNELHAEPEVDANQLVADADASQFDQQQQELYQQQQQQQYEDEQQQYEQQQYELQQQQYAYEQQQQQSSVPDQQNAEYDDQQQEQPTNPDSGDQVFDDQQQQEEQPEWTQEQYDQQQQYNQQQYEQQLYEQQQQQFAEQSQQQEQSQAPETDLTQQGYDQQQYTQDFEQRYMEQPSQHDPTAQSGIDLSQYIDPSDYEQPQPQPDDTTQDDSLQRDPSPEEVEAHHREQSDLQMAYLDSPKYGQAQPNGQVFDINPTTETGVTQSIDQQPPVATDPAGYFATDQQYDFSSEMSQPPPQEYDPTIGGDYRHGDSQIGSNVPSHYGSNVGSAAVSALPSAAASGPVSAQLSATSTYSNSAGPGPFAQAFGQEHPYQPAQSTDYPLYQNGYAAPEEQQQQAYQQPEPQYSDVAVPPASTTEAYPAEPHVPAPAVEPVHSSSFAASAAAFPVQPIQPTQPYPPAISDYPDEFTPAPVVETLAEKKKKARRGFGFAAAAAAAAQSTLPQYSDLAQFPTAAVPATSSSTAPLPPPKPAYMLPTPPIRSAPIASYPTSTAAESSMDGTMMPPVRPIMFGTGLPPPPSAAATLAGRFPMPPAFPTDSEDLR